MKRFLVTLSTSHPKLVIAGALVITLLFASQLPKIHIDTDPENMLRADEPVRLFHHDVKETFDLHDTVVLGIVSEGGAFTPETLGRVARITERIAAIEGVIDYDIYAPTEVDDIFTTDDGTLRVETLMGEVPGDRAAAERVLAQIRKNPILRGKLASDDGQALAIFVPLEEKQLAHAVAIEMERIVEEEGGDEEYHIAGIPIAESRFGAQMFVQMAVYAPIAFLLIFLLMLYFFRSAVMVAAPMMVAMMSVLWAMGLLIGTGHTVHIMSSMIPIFLIPIAVLDAIHILSEFHHYYRGPGTMRETIRATMDELFQPMLFTSVTTAIGFSSLYLTPIPPVQVFGLFVAFGVGTAWLLSITVIPAYAMLVPERAMAKFGAVSYDGDHSQEFMPRMLQNMRRFALHRAKPIVIVGALVFAVSVYGLTKIVVNDNPVRWFKKSHPIRVADAVMNEHLAGTYLAFLAIDAGEPDGMKDPAAMKYVEGLAAALEEHPNVGAATSIVDVVKKVRGELLGDSKEAVLPETMNEIGQNLFLYEMSGGDPGDLFKLITPEADRAVIWVQMLQGENREVSSVVALANEYMHSNPPPELGIEWAGLPYINVVWQQRMVSGMGKALAGSFFVVLVMMISLFRSFKLGLLSMVPLTATITLVYAMIGFSGKAYDMPVAVLSALALGLSIDFAIHFLQRTRELYRESGRFETAMEVMFHAPAQAIVRNIMVVSLGFVPMFFASLVPYITVGAFFFAIMLISGFTTLFVFPAILSLMNPAFLGARRKRGRSRCEAS